MADANTPADPQPMSGGYLLRQANTAVQMFSTADDTDSVVRVGLLNAHITFCQGEIARVEKEQQDAAAAAIAAD